MKKPAALIAVLVLAALAAIGLASCGGSGDDTSGGGGGQKGGTLNGTYASFPDYMDPALSYTAEGWTAMADVYIPLLTYKHANGEEGSEVIPGLAKELPKISNGGETYTLFLRPGLKYSDGTPVKASDFPFAVERMITLNSGGSPFYLSIEGAEKFAETKQGPIPGIETNDKTGEIVINLEGPRGTFTNELGLMFVAPLPQDTPVEDLSADPPPGTGPYMITKSQPGKEWEYERNPYWAKANGKAMPDLPEGVVDSAKMTVIRNPQSQVDDIEQGTYDWMQNPPPSSRYAEVKEKYEGTQFRVEPTISTYYFWMNTQEEPFDDVKVRQAVNYAINSAALERIYAGQIKGTQQILPPGMPGYEKIELYPHDMEKAEELMKEANPSDMDITVWTDTESPNNEAGEYLNEILKELGFNTKLKILNADNYFTVIGNATTPELDAGWSDWFQDYPHPNDFFQPLLAGESILPTNNGNFAKFDDPAVNKQINKLGAEQLGSEQEEAYKELDKEVMEQAPWAPYGTRTLSTFVSDAIDLESVIFNPTFGHYLSSFEFK
ncbi:MAG: peptide/nickel transport system substrate-binding protein [Solirubrobacterales bacterium]|nr:peptide/nickel transport system substrate-binding protein [Solirubrobacterales bacterium]